MSSPAKVTQLLVAAKNGDSAARETLLRLVYDELHSLAAAYLTNERPDHTLQPTALVHEVYVRLLKQQKLPGDNRAQFFALAARAMRRILIDHARTHGRVKRGAEAHSVTLDDCVMVQKEELVALDEALQRLAALEPRKSQVVELRYFGGLTIEEAACALNVSPATVRRDWDVARTWLLGELSEDECDE